MPRTPPAGFLRAVMRPILTASITGIAILALTKCSPNRKNQCNIGGLAKRGLKCSLVMPEKPLAAFLRTVLKLRPNGASSNSNSEGGVVHDAVWQRIAELRGSPFQCLQPTATSALSRACRAEESSGEHERPLPAFRFAVCVTTSPNIG